MIASTTMRRLDRWVGVPVCLLLTLVDSLLRLLRHRSPSPGRLRRVLFIELAEMGAVILAEPALRRVRDRYGATPLFVTLAPNRDALRLTNSVGEDDVFCLRISSLGNLLTDLLRFPFWARRQGVDAVVDLELFTRFSAILAALSGARLRAGLHDFDDEGLWRGNLFTRRVRYEPNVPMARNYLALAEAAFVCPSPSGQVAMADRISMELPKIAESAAGRRYAEKRVAELCPGFDRSRQRLVLLHPNIGDVLPQRRWPRRHYISLIQRLLAAYSDVVAVLIGPSAEYGATAAMAAEIGSSRCAAIAGAFSVAELPSLFSIADLLIASDSGPAHFAAVSALPVIVLFGPETPLRYLPLGKAVAVTANFRCSPCLSAANQRRAGCLSAPCMSTIPVDAVWSRLLPILGAPAGAQCATASAEEAIPARRRA